MREKADLEVADPDLVADKDILRAAGIEQRGVRQESPALGRISMTAEELKVLEPRGVMLEVGDGDLANVDVLREMDDDPFHGSRAWNHHVSVFAAEQKVVRELHAGARVDYLGAAGLSRPVHERAAATWSRFRGGGCGLRRRCCCWGMIRVVQVVPV